MKRIKGLDTLRFICALIVVFGHFGFPFVEAIFLNNNGYFRLIGTAISLVFNGPAAVIVFFIISGFCINYPLTERNQKLNLYTFYIRRLTRIILPAAFSVFLYILLKVELKPPLYGTLWSILCEIIYYILYPFFFYLRKRVSWGVISIPFFILAFILPLLNKDLMLSGNNSYVSLGYLTWLIGLPCWLLGCWLSENYHRFSYLGVKRIWLVRLFVIFFIFILRVIKFHVFNIFAGNCYTLNFFSLLAVVWVGYEIAYFQKHNPPKSLESFGKWSYSLYLMHPLALSLIILSNKLFTIRIDYQFFLLLTSIIISYIFYILVENPSHKFSKYLSKF